MRESWADWRRGCDGNCPGDLPGESSWRIPIHGLETPDNLSFVKRIMTASAQ